MTTGGSQAQRHGSPLYLLAVGPDTNLVGVCRDALRSLPEITFQHLADPQAAVKWARDNDVAAIVVDNDMPGMYGAAFVRQLRTMADRPRPHIVVIERPANPVPQNARFAGIDDILEKPVPRGGFVRLLESALTMRRAERALWEQAAVLKDEVGSAAPVAPAPPPEPPPVDGGLRLADDPAAAPDAGGGSDGPGPPDDPDAPPPERRSRRRALVPWLLVLLLLLLAGFGWDRYRHQPAGRGAAASPNPAASPSASPTPAASVAPAAAPAPSDAGSPSAAPTPPSTPSSSVSPAAGALGGTAGKPDAGSAPGSAANGNHAASGAAPGSQANGSGPSADGSGGNGQNAGAAAAAGAAGRAVVPAGTAGAAHPDQAATAVASASGDGSSGNAGGAGAGGAAAGGSSGAAGHGAAHAPPPLPPDTARAAAAAAQSLAGAPDAGYLVLDSAGREVVANHPDVPRPPASTIKVLTAAVAIATLGPESRFTTRLVAQGTIHDGTIDGSVALVGGGDPVLSSADLNDAAATLQRLGIQRVHGDLVIDATAFTGPEYDPHWAPAERGQPYAAGTSAVSVDEGVGPDRRAVANEEAYAGTVLGNALRAHNVTVDGATRAGRAHDGTVLWTHESPPLSDLITTMLVESDNHIAEQLLREVGRVSSGVGSESAGIASLRRYLVKNHVPVAGLQLYDGSGLALDNRATPRTLATLLWRIQGTAEGDRIHASLPTVEGTLPSGTPGRIIAKTGHVNAARGLVGYVDRKNDALSFAFLDTEAQDSASAARRTDEEDVLHRLAGILP